MVGMVGMGLSEGGWSGWLGWAGRSGWLGSACVHVAFFVFFLLRLIVS